MIPSARLVALAAAGAAAVWIAPEGTGIGVLAAYNTALALLVIVDALLPPRPQQVAVRRTVPSVLSNGAANRVVLTATNRASRPVRLVVRDEFPHEFEASATQPTLHLAPGTSGEVAYTVRPRRRGAYRFGDIHFRLWGTLGLLQKTGRVSASRSVRVYPNLWELRKYELLSRRNRLAEIGLRAARRFGTGTEFESVREYVAGDDVRRINWKATARRGRPMTNEYDIERSRNVILVLETGRLMASWIGDVRKLDLVINAAVLVGQVAADNGDKVGLLAFGPRRAIYVPPRRGRSQVGRILRAIYDLQPERVEPDYEHALTDLWVRNRQRSLVVVFTELIDPEASQTILRPLVRLAARHQVVCVMVQDPPMVALGHRLPKDAVEAYEKALAASALRQRDRAVALLHSRGIPVVDRPPEALSIAVINKYLEIKGTARA
ncbi:MAG: DUF58 domain-containing protein [Armatimonadota bacterium]|nr:DUF58 domain-containing protein [Armatimonadota bacterium]MDR5696112.1 DUF58 domain-containing protein [Armatimonadota bacterium]